MWSVYNFGLKLCLVITSKVCSDFALANTLASNESLWNESLLQTFEGAKVFADFRGKSLQTLEVITPDFRLKVRI